MKMIKGDHIKKQSSVKNNKKFLIVKLTKLNILN